MSLAIHIIGWWFLISLTLGPVLAWSFFWAAKDGNEIALSEERSLVWFMDRRARHRGRRARGSDFAARGAPRRLTNAPRAGRRSGTVGHIGANKGFIGDGAVVSYLNNKGDDHETYGNGTSLCVRALQHLRICPHSSSQVERQDPYHV